MNVKDEEIVKLVNYVAFDNLKETCLLEKECKLAPQLFKSDVTFMNKGKIGNWKSYFSEEQSKRIDEVVEKNLEYKRKPIQYEPSIKK